MPESTCSHSQPSPVGYTELPVQRADASVAGPLTHPAWCHRAHCEPIGAERSMVHRAHIMLINDGTVQVYTKLIRYEDDATGPEALQVELWLGDTEGDTSWLYCVDGVSAWLSLDGARRVHRQLGEQLALAEGVIGRA